MKNRLRIITAAAVISIALFGSGCSREAEYMTVYQMQNDVTGVRSIGNFCFHGTGFEMKDVDWVKDVIADGDTNNVVILLNIIKLD